MDCHRLWVIKGYQTVFHSLSRSADGSAVDVPSFTWALIDQLPPLDYDPDDPADDTALVMYLILRPKLDGLSYFAWQVWPLADERLWSPKIYTMNNEQWTLNVKRIRIWTSLTATELGDIPMALQNKLSDPLGPRESTALTPFPLPFPSTAEPNRLRRRRGRHRHPELRQRPRGPVSRRDLFRQHRHAALPGPVRADASGNGHSDLAQNFTVTVPSSSRPALAASLSVARTLPLHTYHSIAARGSPRVARPGHIAGLTLFAYVYPPPHALAPYHHSHHH
ncbi:hypothetical protein NUW54_g10571 [Trametes sanguinea]|uniref:Uncharacterized protein n=1 Tax=Trametes sanguinea TaxID=158606 RepID=A0ACC1NZY6_9APHY|nr:hypothetical protein NUW54_g10571 [Trametes sanguinea]